MSKRDRKRVVRIENPVSGAGYTNAKAAKADVARGAAVWVDDQKTVIRYIEKARSNIAAQSSVDRFYDRAAHSGLATVDAMRNLPMVNPMAMLVNRMRRRRPASV